MTSSIIFREGAPSRDPQVLIIAPPSVLMPVQPTDIFVRERHYYNRFLGKSLANPLSDAKQMVLFQNIPVTDSDALHGALGTIRQHCSKPKLARIHTAIHHTRG
ncbi:hypothetical protein IU469_31220 [Nocardia puris]|nr:hypothetical protein [Nocardia puris]